MRKQLLNCSLIAGLFLWSATAIGQSYTIGANNGYNTATSYPTPFGDFYKTQRAQYLYLGSEMAGAGMGSGDIKALSLQQQAGKLEHQLFGVQQITFRLKV